MRALSARIAATLAQGVTRIAVNYLPAATHVEQRLHLKPPILAMNTTAAVIATRAAKMISAAMILAAKVGTAGRKKVVS